MKKLLRIFIFTFLVFSIFDNITFAQYKDSNIVKTMLVATINIYDATSTKINAYTYDISFRLKNKVGVQPDIRYGIQLVKKSDGKVLDMDLSNNAITLGEGESKIVNTTYKIPSFIPEGVYRIVIVSQNASGIPLASSPIGFPEKLIIIKDSNNGVSFNNCYLTIPTDSAETRYRIDQGVDILQNEEIKANCEISSNNSISNKDLRLQLITHERNQYGEILDNKIIDQKFETKDNKKENITFIIPVLNRPQAYDIDAFFINANGEKISNSIYIHYVIAGNSATIQNIYLDKTSYKNGDNANIEIFWTPSADRFPLSRLGGTNDNYILNIRIEDSTNNLCGEISKALSDSYDISNISTKITIKKDCDGAKAFISISNDEGTILASQEINTNDTNTEININPDIKKLYKYNYNINKFYIVLFFLVLVLTAYGILVFRKENK